MKNRIKDLLTKCQKAFSKKQLQEPSQSVGYRTTDYFTVIEASEIGEMEEPPFDVGHYFSEAKYKEYLEKVQPLFDEYEKTGTIHTIEYKSLEDIELKREEKLFLDQCRYSFLDIGSYVNVRKNLDGTYVVVTNGRHRMCVAKKYNLRLLVHVAEEEIELISS